MKSDDYIFIPIYPLNYQVSENKDIFEYIKRDILVRLLCTKGIAIDNIEEKTLFSFFSFLKTKKKDVFSFLVDILPQVNIGTPGCNLTIDAKNIKKTIENLNNKFEKHKETEQDIINNFIESFLCPTSIYEYDPISQLITSILKKHLISEVYDTKKEVVLIVEDLDRVDPAHLFRILNIFSAHFEWSGNRQRHVLENKFGFHKIVLVADFENIHCIYKHLYGPTADFDGYIGKFLTSKHFPFSITKSRINFIRNNLNDRIKTYPKISRCLSESIAEINISIRQLEQFLLKTPIIMTWRQVLIDGVFANHHLNDLAYFLRICSIFKLKPMDVLLKNKNNTNLAEILKLVGIGWIAIIECDNGDVIKIFDKEGSDQYRKQYCSFNGFKYQTNDEKEIISFDFDPDILQSLTNNSTYFYYNGKNILSNALIDRIKDIFEEYSEKCKL